MNLSTKQIEAIAKGRALASVETTETLLAAVMNAIAADARVSNEDAAQVTALLGALFSALTEEPGKGGEGAQA